MSAITTLSFALSLITVAGIILGIRFQALKRRVEQLEDSIYNTLDALSRKKKDK